MNIPIGKVQQFLDWMKVKLYLDSNAASASKRLVKRGQVYRCNFGVGIGSEMQKDRPAIIMQNDIGNLKSGNTVVVPVTHDASPLPCMAQITPHYEADGVTLLLDGQANTSNIMCVSKARIGNYICTLSDADMKRVDEALAKTVGLIGHYSDLSKKLNDKLNYIAKLKQERNAAQDELIAVRSLFQLEPDADLLSFLESMKKNLDKKQ